MIQKLPVPMSFNKNAAEIAELTAVVTAISQDLDRLDNNVKRMGIVNRVGWIVVGLLLVFKK